MIDAICSERDERRASAALYLPRPTDIIEGAEEWKFVTAYPSAFNVFDFSQPQRRVVVVPLGGITAALPAGVVVVIDKVYPAGDLEVVQSVETAKRIDADRRWSDATGWHQGAANPKSSLRLKVERGPASAAKLRVERLAAIQAALGLPVQVLAEVLRISRPGLYKWLDDKQDIALQADNRQRLAAIEQLAKQWRERSNTSLNSVAHEPLANGHTVLEILSAENVDEATAAAAFNELTAKLQSKPKTLSQRMSEAGFKRRPSHRSLPTDD